MLVRWTSGEDMVQTTVVHMDWVRGSDALVFGGTGIPQANVKGKDDVSAIVECTVGKPDKQTNKYGVHHHSQSFSYVFFLDY